MYVVEAVQYPPGGQVQKDPPPALQQGESAPTSSGAGKTGERTAAGWVVAGGSWLAAGLRLAAGRPLPARVRLVLTSQLPQPSPQLRHSPRRGADSFTVPDEGSTNASAAGITARGPGGGRTGGIKARPGEGHFRPKTAPKQMAQLNAPTPGLFKSGLLSSNGYLGAEIPFIRPA